MANIARLPLPLLDVYDWQFAGACLEADPELFFPPEAERGPRRRARERAAKSYCVRCPVIAECLRHALAVREPYGVWGGLTTGERANVAAGTAAS